MDYLRSITLAHKVYPTNGSHPVEIIAEDLETYICKYSLSPAYGLMREYLGHQFAMLWGLYVPPAAFVHVEKAHVPIGDLPDRFGYAYFDLPTFGVQKHPSAEEVSRTFGGKSDYELRQIDQGEFLKVALFDLWLANEDRHQGNFNLMLAAPDDISHHTLLRFMPIDHFCIFNSGTMDQKIYLISENESLLDSVVRQRLYGPRSKEKLRKATQLLLSHFPAWVHACRSQADTLLGNIPPTWGVEIPYISRYLTSNIFAESWVQEVSFTFSQRIQAIIN